MVRLIFIDKWNPLFLYLQNFENHLSNCLWKKEFAANWIFFYRGNVYKSLTPLPSAYINFNWLYSTLSGVNTKIMEGLLG